MQDLATRAFCGTAVLAPQPAMQPAVSRLACNVHAWQAGLSRNWRKGRRNGCTGTPGRRQPVVRRHPHRLAPASLSSISQHLPSISPPSPRHPHAPHRHCRPPPRAVLQPRAAVRCGPPPVAWPVPTDLLYASELRARFTHDDARPPSAHAPPPPRGLCARLSVCPSAPDPEHMPERARTCGGGRRGHPPSTHKCLPAPGPSRACPAHLGPLFRRDWQSPSARPRAPQAICARACAPVRVHISSRTRAQPSTFHPVHFHRSFPSPNPRGSTYQAGRGAVRTACTCSAGASHCRRCTRARSRNPRPAGCGLEACASASCAGPRAASAAASCGARRRRCAPRIPQHSLAPRCPPRSAKHTARPGC